MVTHSGRALIQVWDGSNRVPQPRKPHPDAESGRVLWLVEALSEDWGAFHPEYASGKVVWALAATP